MDRFWFFTWRTYGTWLPGEPGFVGQYVNAAGERRTENAPGRPTAGSMPRLAAYAKGVSRSPAVSLTTTQAGVVCEQLLETGAFRGRQIDAIAVLVDHIHLVFGVSGDPDHEKMLSDWKAYASRALNQLAVALPAQLQPNGTSHIKRPERRLWWAEHGSTRLLKTSASRTAAIRYVRDQVNPLVVWLGDEAKQILEKLVSVEEASSTLLSPRR